MYHHLKANRILGPRIRAHRLQRGMTQAEVAKRLHLHREALSVLESGQQTLNVPQLVILVDVFELGFPDALIVGLPTG